MTSPADRPVGVLARFSTTSGSADEAAAFFREGRAIVADQPAATVWFAFRIDATTYGAFAAFASAQDREALLAAGGPQLSRTYAHLFTAPPTFELVDVLETRLETPPP